MSKVYGFEKLATTAIERDLKNLVHLLHNYDAGITIFQTEHVPKEDQRTVTVWFEVKTSYPEFWDIKPVIIIYEGHNLYLSDIRARTTVYFHDTVKAIQRRLVKQSVKESSYED